MFSTFLCPACNYVFFLAFDSASFCVSFIFPWRIVDTLHAESSSRTGHEAAPSDPPDMVMISTADAVAVLFVLLAAGWESEAAPHAAAAGSDILVCCSDDCLSSWKQFLFLLTHC